MKTFLNDSFSPSLLKSHPKLVFGTLNPIMWDRRGRIKKFSIYSIEDEDIIIEGFRNKAKLRSLLYKRVEARGLVSINEDGEKIIKLTEIREITGPNSPAMDLLTSFNAGMWDEEFSVRTPKGCSLSQYENLQDRFFEAC